MDGKHSVASRYRAARVPGLAGSGFTSRDSQAKVTNVSFEAVYRAERSRLIRYLMSMGADQHQADDAVQAAFARAYAGWETIRQPRAWLYKVALRELYRAEARVRKREMPAGDALPEAAGPLDSGDIAVLNEEEEMVRAAVAALPGRQRQVMALTLAGFKPAEIARELGCDPAAVRQNQVRARDNLARQLGIDRRNAR
jgi:RNA polymerase sigma factor (sigma-70 family)